MLTSSAFRGCEMKLHVSPSSRQSLWVLDVRIRVWLPALLCSMQSL